MKTSKRRDIMFIATIVAVIGFGGLAFYLEKKHDARIAAIMTGEIRGNKESRIFHVPTCSQYDSIKPSHLRTFATVEEAEEANYRPSPTASMLLLPATSTKPK